MATHTNMDVVVAAGASLGQKETALTSSMSSNEKNSNHGIPTEPATVHEVATVETRAKSQECRTQQCQ